MVGAAKYHLHVNGPGAKIPIINRNDLEWPQLIHSVRGYIINSNRKYWQWIVRAFVNGEWEDWLSP